MKINILRKFTLSASQYSGLAYLYSKIDANLGSILMLHRVSNEQTSPFGFNQNLSIAPQFLDDLISTLKKAGYSFVCYDEMIEHLLKRGSRAKLLTLTADDGYRDNITHALPILESHNVPMLIYIAPGLIEHKKCLWWEVIEQVIATQKGFYLPSEEGPALVDCHSSDAKYDAWHTVQTYLQTRHPELDLDRLVKEIAVLTGTDFSAPSQTLLNWDEIRTASRHPLITIGAHSVNHYALARLPTTIAQEEIMRAGEMLELELGIRPLHMAYPYGNAAAAGEREGELAAKAGFKTAVTTRHGVLRSAHANHLQMLPRISINGWFQSPHYVQCMVSGISTPLANKGKRVVTH